MPILGRTLSASIAVHVGVAACLHWTGKQTFGVVTERRPNPPATTVEFEPAIAIDVVVLKPRARARARARAHARAQGKPAPSHEGKRGPGHAPPSLDPFFLLGVSGVAQIRASKPPERKQPSSGLTPLQKEMRVARTPTPWYERNPLAMEIPKVPGPMPRPKGELKPSGNGTHTKDQLGWSAKVRRDGSVSFKDKPSFRIHHFGPCFSCMVSGFRSWAKDPESFKKKKKRFVTVPIIGGGFDVTDWVMRRAKQDPYSYQKAQFLKRTRKQRMRMAAVENSSNLQDAVFRMSRSLRAIWANGRWSYRKRRHLLFELWDECAETGTREVVATTAQIRATIVAFVRHHLPMGSKHAYGPRELKLFDARKKSRSVFSPYER